MEGKWLYVLMILAAIVMFYANHEYKSKGVPWGRPLAGLCGILAVILALSQIAMSSCQPSRERAKIIDREMRYVRASMEYLGNYLGDNFAGQQMLLITNQVNEYNRERHEMMIDGLKDGLKSRVTFCAETAPEAPSTPDGTDMPMPPEDFYFTAEAFDKMIAEHKNCTLVVTLIGLPMDMRNMKFWALKPDKRPKLVVAFGSIYELKVALQKGFVQAAVSYNPKYVYDVKEEVPEDYNEAFNKRYLLIDKSNIDAIDKENPGMFMEVKK